MIARIVPFRDRNRPACVIARIVPFRLPVDLSRIPAPRPGKSNRRMGASRPSFHSASASSSLLSSPPGSSSTRWSGVHLLFFFLQSAHVDRLRPRFISGYLAEGDEAFLIGVGQGQGAGRGAPKRPRACRSAGPLAAAGPRRPSRPARPCPGGAPIEKMAGFAGL